MQVSKFEHRSLGLCRQAYGYRLAARLVLVMLCLQYLQFELFFSRLFGGVSGRLFEGRFGLVTISWLAC